MNTNVISIRAYKAFKETEVEELAYQAKIMSMDKVQLLEEMVRFQEERKVLGTLDHPMMIRGRHLFRALETAADTQELKILSRSYRRHLDYEISSLRSKSLE